MPTYSFRRDLTPSDRMKAIGIGAGAGMGMALAATYLAGIFLARAPLRPPPILVEEAPPADPPRGRPPARR